MNATDMLHLTDKLDMILSEVDDIKQLLSQQILEQYKENNEKVDDYEEDNR
jgi:hypothetical protein